MNLFSLIIISLFSVYTYGQEFLYMSLQDINKPLITTVVDIQNTKVVLVNNEEIRTRKCNNIEEPVYNENFPIHKIIKLPHSREAYLYYSKDYYKMQFFLDNFCNARQLTLKSLAIQKRYGKITNVIISFYDDRDDYYCTGSAGYVGYVEGDKCISDLKRDLENEEIKVINIKKIEPDGFFELIADRLDHTTKYLITLKIKNI